MSDNRPSAYRDGDLFVVRASALGGCLWELIATGQGYEPLPWPEKIQRAMDVSAGLEDEVIARLRELGWSFYEADFQKEGELRVGDRRVVRYHPDGIALVPQYGDRRVVEIKALADSSWRKARRHGVGAAFPSYAWQLSVMMLGEALPGVWVVLNKDSGELHFEYVSKPPQGWIDVYGRVREIADAVDGEPITRTERPCDTPEQWPCLFLHLRPEPESVKEEVAEPAEDMLEAWLATVSDYTTARQDEADAKARKDNARKSLLALARVGLDNEDPTPTLAYQGLKVGWKLSTRSTLDRKALEADGVDLDKYTKVTTSESINVEGV